MLALQALLALSLGASVHAQIDPASRIQIPGREVRVGDLVKLDGISAAARARVASRVVAVLPRGRDSITLSRAGLASLIRRSVPGLAFSTEDEATLVTIGTLSKEQPAEVSKSQCFVLSHAVVRGEALSSADVVPAECERGRALTRVAFDRKGSVARAIDSFAAGTHLGPVSLPSAEGVDRGATLTLVSTVGPVRIERSVVAVQPGRSGGSIFVRDEDGKVLAAPLSMMKSGEAKR